MSNSRADEIEVELVQLVSNSQPTTEKVTDNYTQIKSSFSKAQEWRAFLVWGIRLIALIKNIVFFITQAVAIIGKFIPVLRAIVNGVYAVMDLVDILIFPNNQDKKEHRLIKTATSVLSGILAVIAVLLVLHPATLATAIAISATIMAIAAIRDAYFWYEAKMATEKKHRKHENKIHNPHQVDEKAQQHVAERKWNFSYNLLSCIGTTFLALAAFATAGAIALNPISLMIIGVCILACGVVNGGYNLYVKAQGQTILSSQQPVEKIKPADIKINVPNPQLNSRAPSPDKSITNHNNTLSSTALTAVCLGAEPEIGSITSRVDGDYMASYRLGNSVHSILRAESNSKNKPNEHIRPDTPHPAISPQY